MTSISKKNDPQLIGGATCSGSWLCIDALDRLTHIQTSVITPWIQNLQEALKAIHSKGRRKSKSSSELVLPYSGRLTVSKSAFMCFTISPGFPGRTDLPENLTVSQFVKCKRRCFELTLTAIAGFDEATEPDEVQDEAHSGVLVLFSWGQRIQGSG